MDSHGDKLVLHAPVIAVPATVTALPRGHLLRTKRIGIFLLSVSRVGKARSVLGAIGVEYKRGHRILR